MSDSESRNKRRQKMPPTLSPFDLLNDDALRTVLVRTRAMDHDALRRTCQRFRNVLLSSLFRQDRAVSGYAEVQTVHLWSPFEQYKQYKQEIMDEMSQEER